MFKRIVSAIAIATAALSTAQAETHLGAASASSHVTLVAKWAPNSVNNCSDVGFSHQNFYRLRPDGTTEATPFVVLNGQKLVVTDVEWAAYGFGAGPNNSGPFVANRAVRLDLRLVKPNTAGTGFSAYTSRGVVVAPALVNEILSDVDHLTAGFVVGPSVSICPSAYQSSVTSMKVARIEKLVLHGYLSE